MVCNDKKNLIVDQCIESALKSIINTALNWSKKIKCVIYVGQKLQR